MCNNLLRVILLLFIEDSNVLLFHNFILFFAFFGMGKKWVEMSL